MKIKIPLEMELKFNLEDAENDEEKWRLEYRGPYDNPLTYRKKKYNPITDPFNK